MRNPHPAEAAGTVGDDVLTVHALEAELDRHGGLVLRPKCGAGGPGELVTEWLRAVNCPDCLALDHT
ncbi:hypothetical protein [Streptomyces sp. NPDC050560]|uniref:hypothetical protein n=1 Tax=Streptomyces sp. NPDC050560 TaxID=3365630 RepID=UPI0037A55965